MSVAEDVAFIAMVAVPLVMLFGIPDAIIDVLVWAAPKALQVGIAVFGGTIIRKLVRLTIKRRFGLEVPV